MVVSPTSSDCSWAIRGHDTSCAGLYHGDLIAILVYDQKILISGLLKNASNLQAFMDNPFQSQPRVVIVDDEISIAKMMSVVLQMNLFDAFPYADPRQALEDARAEPPDYLITDINMHGMTGIELATLVRQEIPACKILLFSGQPEAPEMVKQARDAGHDFTFLQKPIHPTQLVAVIKSL